MKIVMGKTPNYDKDGNLKNAVIMPKYDELELANCLDDDNWKKLGACEIECISCIDYTLPTKTAKEIIIRNDERKIEVNKIIKGQIKIKPKTEVELLKEEMAEMKKMLSPKKSIDKLDLGSTRKNIEEKANELDIKFRQNIGDEKLLDKIQEVEPDFKI